MNRSILIAAAIGLGAMTWVASGQLVAIGDPAAGMPPASSSSSAAAAAAAAEPMLVLARTIEAQPYAREIVLQGRSATGRWVEVSAETQGRVAALPVAKGAAVRAGDVIVRLAVEERAARRAESEALLHQRRIEHATSTALAEKGFRATNRLAESQAGLDAARAAAKAMDVEMARTVIRAPFGGVVEERRVEIGAYLKAGDGVIRLVERDPMLIVAQVGEREVAQLRPGQAGRATLVTGETVEGRIRFIGGTADPATRTFPVELEVANPDGRLRDGITAELRLRADPRMAHLVPPAILTLDDDGALGLRVVEDDGRVAFKPAQLLGDGPEGVWLGGLPETITVITVGQEFVRAGDPVRVARASASRPSASRQ
ncbi:hemolysin D [Allostella vacuolata]|nr:hemolysin D [Stella vacuolata]